MQNGLLFQAFEWQLPADSAHWTRLMGAAPELKTMGVSSVWLPPAYKGTSVNDTGYSTYDLYDVGEFEQKGTVATKYGTADELAGLVTTLHDLGIQVYADVVLNHKAGADEKETFQAVPVNPDNRLEALGPAIDIEGWTKFTFPGRRQTYSPFVWTFQHFTAVDYDAKRDKKGIFRIVGENKGFGFAVDGEHGNFDYLMHADIDVAHPDVAKELMSWGEWYMKRFGFDGIRLDAVKHIDEPFIRAFVDHLREAVKPDLYAVGEYWTGDIERMREYLSGIQYHVQLFDVALHFAFERIANDAGHADIRQVFSDTLVATNPMNVVTFVDNHDSQPGQSLESFVDAWFKPLAYALILLRRDGYPCLFYGDYYGIGGGEGLKAILDPLLIARRDYAYGDQIDAFYDEKAIAFVRTGDDEHPASGLVAVLSIGDASEVHLELGSERAGQVWHDLTQNRSERLTLDDQGGATFPVNGGSVSVWVQTHAS